VKREAFLRCCPCFACGRPSTDDQRTEPHHWPTRGSGRSHPRKTLPLCFFCHTGSDVAFHVLGVESFQEYFGFQIGPAMEFIHELYDRIGAEEWADNERERARFAGACGISAWWTGMPRRPYTEFGF
jgi:hypothetical protein